MDGFVNLMDALTSDWLPQAVIIFDIDGVVRDVSGSYRRAIADTVQYFTDSQYRPTSEEIDVLKAEGAWNNDWEASRELINRFYQTQGVSTQLPEFQSIVDFFQSKYRGENFNGYIKTEPLLMSRTYLEALTQAKVAWAFFSGATRASAEYVLKGRLGLDQLVLVAMEDAPGKPDPTGLFETLTQLAHRHGFSPDLSEPLNIPILYVGDTVADMQTVVRAQQIHPLQQWIGIGVIPPHVQQRSSYAYLLQAAGAVVTLESVELLSPTWLNTELSL